MIRSLFRKRVLRISCQFPEELPLTLPRDDSEITKALPTDVSSRFHVQIVLVYEILCVVVYKPAILGGVVYCQEKQIVIRCLSDASLQPCKQFALNANANAKFLMFTYMFSFTLNTKFS